MSSYQENRQWSDTMIPQIKQIVGPYLLGVADFEHDTKQATDLMILTARDMRIAARVRRPGFADRYPNEFTIRASRSSGYETELSKIVNGWGDWLFYGHADGGNQIINWMLICLHAFRAALIRNAMNGTQLKITEKANGDGTFFKAFDVRSFPANPPILVASNPARVLPIAQRGIGDGADILPGSVAAFSFGQAQAP